MATYYSSSGNQRDMPTVYSNDPENSSYPVPSVMGNLLYPNHSSSGPYSEFVGVTSVISQDSSTEEPDLIASHLGHHSYNALKDGRNEMLFMQMIGGSPNSAADLVQSSVAEDPHNSGRLQFGILNGQNLNFQQPNMPNVQGQGLSLSLGTQILMPSFQYLPAKPEISTINSHQLNLLGNGESHRDDDFRMKHMQSDASRTIPSSKYLKAAQALLDEVVNVRKALKQKAQKCQNWNKSAGMTDCKDSDWGSKGGVPLNPDETNANSSNELSPSERQELQNKMTKLLVMLDEVDRKYKHYYNQMQIVVSSFDVVAGSGAAKPYTAVALQTISRHFRCLRDAITDQIQSIRKVLGEEDSSTGKAGGFTRLRYIDQQLRQQRAVQQFGMIQQNCWRPQRGLPEDSVSVLRAWLFEHFLHPYPKDSEKLMLARQTGLTRSQISNWFINARVRLWKPMIEDMYKEEIGDMEMESNSSSDNVPRSKDEIGSSEEREGLKSSSERSHTSQFNDSKANNSNMNLGGAEIGFHKEANADDTFMNLMLRGQRPDGRDGGLLHDAVTQISDGNGRFMSYQMAKIGNYGNGSVSLTLGLHHSDGGLPVPNSQQGFPDVRGEEIYSTAPLGINGSDYDSMGLMDQRQIEAPPLLHDFVG